MKRFILLTVMVMMLIGVQSAQSVEILLQARHHWMQQGDTANYTPEQLEKMRRQEDIGSPIVIKPDGWTWGLKERPPQFVVLTIPGVTVAQASKYLSPLIDTLFDTTSTDPLTVDTTEYTKKLRKWRFPQIFIDSAKVYYQRGDPIELTITQAKALIRYYKRDGSTTIGDDE